MQNKLMMAKDFKDIEKKGDATNLLKEIHRVSLQIETNTSVYDAMDEAKTVYYKYKQDKHESNAKHLKKIKSIVETVEYLGGVLFTDPSLRKHECEIDKVAGVSRADEAKMTSVKEKSMSIGYLKRTKDEHNKLITTIRDQHTFGVDVCLKKLNNAYELVENHSSTSKKRSTRNARTDRGGRTQYRGGRGGRHIGR